MSNEAATKPLTLIEDGKDDGGDQDAKIPETEFNQENSDHPNPTDPNANDSSQIQYRTRRIDFPVNGRRNVRILCQSENGPCALIAICNCLLLNGDSDFQLPPENESSSSVSSAELLNALAGYLLSKPGISDRHLEYLHRLESGVLINPHLSHPQSYDIEDPLAKEILEASGVPVYHAWTIDLERDAVNSGLGDCKDVSYQGLVDEMLRLESLPPDQVEEHTRALRIKLFLEQSANQCTAHGLQVLGDLLPWDRCVIFFRNNHFATLLKLRVDRDVEQLYQLVTLVTDVGFMGANGAADGVESAQEEHLSRSQMNCCWETISRDGNSQFLDEHFRPPGSAPILPPRPSQSDQTPGYIQSDAAAGIEGQKSPGVFSEFVRDVKDALGLNSNATTTPTSSTAGSTQPTPAVQRKRRESSKNGGDCLIQ